MSANFLPDQYDDCKQYNLNHNYLTAQFDDYEAILKKIGEVVTNNDFTLGRAVDEFETNFAKVVGAKYAVGVGSGTDALFLSLRALDIKPGDEVITTPFTFFATIGAIVTSGATPVFVDVGDDYNLDVAKISDAITAKTRAIMPVHWSGRPCDMHVMSDIAQANNLAIVQDACHAIEATYANKHLVEYSDFACYSMHPLKNLNVWGDGGVFVTNNQQVAERMALIRNHGLLDRDTCQEFSYNSRLDTIQAVVANHLISNRLANTTRTRQRNSALLAEALCDIESINLKPQCVDKTEVFHLFQITCERRDELQQYLQTKGVDAKVHYPVPMHLQPAAEKYGYQAGDLPNAEFIAKHTLSLPVHEFIDEHEIMAMAQLVKGFYQ